MANRIRAPHGRALLLIVTGLAGAAPLVHCDAGTGEGGGGSSVPRADSASAPTTAADAVATATVPVDPTTRHAAELVDEGRTTFRYDTFGDEAFWGGALKLHDAIRGRVHGGTGDGLSPKAALALGLKVDVEALPPDVVASLKAGTVDLESVDVTLALLGANAVLGVTGFFDDRKNLTSVGLQCAFCHSTVDDSLAPGIGHRLDAWANRDLDVGAIIALAPDLTPVTSLLGVPDPAVRGVLRSWGPGHFNAQLFLDGRAVGPSGRPAEAAPLIPPAFGLGGVNLATSTGFGSGTYWNAFVANLEMHGQGTFIDPRLKDGQRFPVAADAGFASVRSAEDRISPKLPALQFYQHAVPVPVPPEGSFDATAAVRGRQVFEGAGRCASCHVAPTYTEPGWNMHTAAELGIDDFQASRSPEQRYRTAPLRGLFTHTKGGFYHDGRFATLLDVVEHYDDALRLGLGAPEKRDLVEFLKSL